MQQQQCTCPQGCARAAAAAIGVDSSSAMVAEEASALSLLLPLHILLCSVPVRAAVSIIWLHLACALCTAGPAGTVGFGGPGRAQIGTVQCCDHASSEALEAFALGVGSCLCGVVVVLSLLSGVLWLSRARLVLLRLSRCVWYAGLRFRVSQPALSMHWQTCPPG